MSKRYQYQCVCSWPECQKIRNNLIKLCPSNHVWCQPIIRIQFTRAKNDKKLSLPTLRKLAFNRCLFLYLHIKTEVDIHQRNKCIWPHHFPTALLQWKQEQQKKPNFFTFLKKFNMQSISVLDYGSERLLENKNTFASVSSPYI